MVYHPIDTNRRIHIRKAERTDLPHIADLIVRVNRLPEQQCLHCAEDEEGVHNGIAALSDTPEAMFVVAVEHDRIVGVLGYEGAGADAWVWGPFVTSEPWAEVTELLFSAFLQHLPPTITMLRTFSHIANQRSHQFYLSHGFHEAKTAHIYIAASPADLSMLQRVEPCSELTDAHVPAFEQLHARVFPDTPISAQEIVDSLDDEHRVYVVADGTTVLGYVYATINHAPVEGYVEFLAVQPHARGQGIGQRLLLTALRWFFVDKTMPQAGLFVEDERINARFLYERVGFTLAYTGVSAIMARRAEGV